MRPTTIAIIGAGKFGAALHRLLTRYAPDVPVLVIDLLPGGDRLPDLPRLSRCEVVIPAVPISAFASVLGQIAPHLRKDALVIDVCTVKHYPTEQMIQLLPASVDLISSHPLFGPESLASAGWNLAGLNLVLWPTRIPRARFDALLDALRPTGLNLIELSPEEHDRILADSQFLSLLVGNLLTRLDIRSTAMNTRSFDELLDVRATTANDFAILRDVFRYNPYCAPVLERLRATFAALVDDLNAG